MNQNWCCHAQATWMPKNQTEWQISKNKALKYKSTAWYRGVAKL